MTIEILMPALSPTMEEGALAKWLVKVGDKVKAGDVLAEIETDKATMEIEAVDEGVVSKILIPEGSQGVKINTPIATLSDDAEEAAPAVKSKPAPSAPKAAPPPAQPETEAIAKPTASAAPPAKGDRLKASPLARKLAAASGLDLASVKGSGPGGRIVKADLNGAKKMVGESKAEEAGPAAAPGLPALTRGVPAMPVKSLEALGIPSGSYDLVPLDGMRRTIAKRLTDSFRDIPHFPLNIDLEIDRLLEIRSRVNAALTNRNIKVSVNDFVIRAAALALKAVPAANASFSPEGIALHHHADIAVAVAIDGGLITPIVRQAETKGLAQIATEMKDLAERARAKKLKPHEYQGGTFSISNLGMYGIKSFSSIINEPQGAIMSVGAGEKRPVVHGDQLAVATVMTVTLTCDHRVVDGSIGAQFIQAFKVFIEDPTAMLV
ncbi:MAG: pyruvate dehydrogenase complex dihydrolipoamide acetyltransferase [Caulobacterales bacterium]